MVLLIKTYEVLWIPIYHDRGSFIKKFDLILIGKYEQWIIERITYIPELPQHSNYFTTF